MPRTKPNPVTVAQQAVDAAATVVQQWLDETRDAQSRLDSLAQVGAAILDNPSTLGETASQRAALEQRIILCTQACGEAQERHMAARRALHAAEADLLEQDIQARQEALAEHELAVADLVQQLKDLTGVTWQPYGQTSTGDYWRPSTMANRMQYEINKVREEMDRLRAIGSGQIDLAALDAAAAQSAAERAEQVAYDQMIAERRVTFGQLLEELREHGVVSEVEAGGPSTNGHVLEVAESGIYEPPEAYIRQALLSAGTDQRPGVDREWRQRVLTIAGGCMDRLSFVALARWMDQNPQIETPTDHP